MKLGLLTDIHLNFLSQKQRHKFYTEIQAKNFDHLVIAGDIGEFFSFDTYLVELVSKVRCPIDFVLGNHDFYRGTIKGARHKAMGVQELGLGLTYLSSGKMIRLNDRAFLIGHDGWADTRAGDYKSSFVMLSDFDLIQDFLGLEKYQRGAKMAELANDSLEVIEPVLSLWYKEPIRLFIATHVPPFEEIALYRGEVSDPYLLPFFVNKILGELILTYLNKKGSKIKITVLCGHTHYGLDVNLQPRLRCIVGSSDYNIPQIKEIKV